MTEIYKIVNVITPPIMTSLFEYLSKLYNLRNFQDLSTDKRNNVNYDLETVTYKSHAIWTKLPSINL